MGRPYKSAVTYREPIVGRQNREPVIIDTD